MLLKRNFKTTGSLRKDFLLKTKSEINIRMNILVCLGLHLRDSQIIMKGKTSFLDFVMTAVLSGNNLAIFATIIRTLRALICSYDSRVDEGNASLGVQNCDVFIYCRRQKETKVYNIFNIKSNNRRPNTSDTIGYQELVETSR